MKEPDTKGYIFCFHLYVISRIGKSTEMEHRSVVSRDWRGITTGTQGFLLGWWEHFETIEVLVAWHCDCSKCHWIVHFTIVNFMLSKFCPIFFLKSQNGTYSVEEGRKVLWCPFFWKPECFCWVWLSVSQGCHPKDNPHAVGLRCPGLS